MIWWIIAVVLVWIACVPVVLAWGAFWTKSKGQTWWYHKYGWYEAAAIAPISLVALLLFGLALVIWFPIAYGLDRLDEKIEEWVDNR